MLRVPFGRQRTLGVVVELARESELDPDRLAEPYAVLPAGVPPDLVELARWMADEYCSTFARALGLLLAPGATDGVGHRKVLVAELTNTGRDALRDGDRLNDRQKSLLEALERDGPTVAATLGTPALRRLQKRGLVDVGPQTQVRRPVGIDVGLRPGPPPALTDDQRQRPGRGARRARAPARSRRGRAAVAARRHRLGQDRGVPAGRRGGPGARPNRDRARPRDRTHAAGPVAVQGTAGRRRRGAALGLSARASDTTNGCACATARLGSASGRARQCSHRCPTSG